jgi:hypothetical protein
MSKPNVPKRAGGSGEQMAQLNGHPLMLPENGGFLRRASWTNDLGTSKSRKGVRFGAITRAHDVRHCGHRYKQPLRWRKMLALSPSKPATGTN